MTGYFLQHDNDYLSEQQKAVPLVTQEQWCISKMAPVTVSSGNT